jgi:hypothetical protein
VRKVPGCGNRSVIFYRRRAHYRMEDRERVGTLRPAGGNIRITDL